MCLACNRVGQMGPYREVNLNANPSGAAAFKTETQRDVGGSFEERVRQVVKEWTGLGSAQEARRKGANPWTNLREAARRKGKQAAKLIQKAGFKVAAPIMFTYPENTAGANPVDLAPQRRWFQLMREGRMESRGETL